MFISDYFMMYILAFLDLVIFKFSNVQILGDCLPLCEIVRDNI